MQKLKEKQQRGLSEWWNHALVGSWGKKAKKSKKKSKKKERKPTLCTGERIKQQWDDEHHSCWMLETSWGETESGGIMNVRGGGVVVWMGVGLEGDE
jgi:hypothetical protein